MPELPEVETLRRELEAGLVGRRIEQAELLTPKIYSGAPEYSIADVVGTRVERVRRRAKYLIVDLSNGLSLVVHLGLAGQIVLERSAGERTSGGHPVPAYGAPLPHKQTHVILRIDDGSVLFLTDIRKFAHLWVVASGEVNTAVPEERLGVEILGEGFTLPEFTRRMRARGGSRLKPLLLDQSAIAGLGNIYVDESLWGAQLHPLRTAGSLTDAELADLWESIRFVIDLALARGVAQVLNGKAVVGAELPRVHGREGQPCPRCGRMVEKSRVVGRGTYICPGCQLPPTTE